MKKNLTVFVCDSCNKELSRDSNAGFPYSEGWQYIYTFEGKILGDKLVRQYNHFDKHFCSGKCLLEFVKKETESKVNKKCSPNPKKNS